MTKYRNLLILATAVVLCLPLLCSCDVDLYKGRRPTDQPNTKWVCTEYDISFEVSDQGLIENGIFRTEDQEYEIVLLWAAIQNKDMPDVMVMEPQSDNYREDSLFAGFCKFSKKYFEIRISYDPYGFFPEDTTLRFERVNGE